MTENDTLRFDGRTALITGASQGVGREYALLLASRGAQIVANGRSEAPLAQIVDEIVSAGGDAVAVVGDVSTYKGAIEIAENALAAFGKIDILINNAGVSIRKTFGEVLESEYRHIVATNLDSHFFLTQHLWPHFLKNKYARIVNTTSGTGLFGTKNNHHYACAKGGVAGFTKSLSIDGKVHNILVNAVAPMAATRLANQIQDDDFKKVFFARLPASRCAPMVAWLSHESCNVSGEIFDLGGGQISRVFTAMGEGYFNPEMTLEDVKAHIGQIMSEENYALPKDGERRTMDLLKKVEDYESQ